MENTSFTIQKDVSVNSNSELVPLIKIVNSRACSSNSKKLFAKSIPNVPLQGRLPYFITIWKKATQNQEISIVKRYKFQFVSLTLLKKKPNLTKMSKEQFSLVEQNILEMLEKRTIHKLVPTQGQFLNSFFLVEKKDGRNRPVINL